MAEQPNKHIEARREAVTRARPELLCPAGDRDAMRAAVANGADAVYFGLPAFNARHRATNFTLDALPETMRYLHRHNVRGFVALNVLIFSDELADAADYVRQIAAAGVDAVIVQDLGFTTLIRALAPTLEIHGSTQMTLTEPRGIRFVQRLGVSRVVLAREMSVAEIARVTAAVPEMPVEVFVHGALCVAYSGQCLTSESFGGRSANRGQCAQACRMPYELIVDGTRRALPGDVRYLVSPQDLGAWELVDAMTKAGIASFKIEGRLKGANYVAQTAQVYRDAIDAAASGAAWALDATRERDLTLVYSRGFSHGFLSGVDHQTLVPGRFPKSRGVKIGTVVGTTSRGFIVRCDEVAGPTVDTLPLAPGDGIVFDEGRPETDEAHGQIYKVEAWRGGPTRQASSAMQVASRDTLIHIELGNRDARPGEIELVAIVWQTSDPQLNKRLAATHADDRVVHRAPVDAVLTAHVGANPRLTITDGVRVAEAAYEQALEPAQKFAISEEHARRQLDRFRDTPFALRGLTLDAAGGPMVPNSILADLRRRATEQLVELRHQSAVRTIENAATLEAMRASWHGRPAHDDFTAAQRPLRDSELSRAGRPCHADLHVLARTMEQIDALLALDEKPSSIYCDFEDVRRYKPAVDACRAANVPVALATIRIVKPGEEGWLNQVLLCEPDAYLVRNLAAIEFFRERAPHVRLIGDFSLNIANELTAGVYRDAGVARGVPSYDLSWQQMSAMIGRFDPAWFECVVHQHMPMFHMEHCVFAATLSTGKDFRDCGRPCERHAVDLRDQTGQPHPLIPDAGCRNTLFNAAAQSALTYLPRMMELGVRHVRVELLRERGFDVASIVGEYQRALRGDAPPARQALRSLRVLSQLGVTAGTLDRE